MTSDNRSLLHSSFMSSSILELAHVEDDLSWIPEGYVVVRGPDGQRYVVPEFCVSALHQILDGLGEKKKLEVDKFAGTVSDIINS